MARVNSKTFEWDYHAAEELIMKSEDMAKVCEEQAARMTRATGMEYRPDIYVGETRVNAGGFDEMSHEDASYKTRKNGKRVYTEHKIKKG